MKTHNEYLCSKYNEQVLPDEDGNCSLCGAKLTPDNAWQVATKKNRFGFDNYFTN